MSLLETIHTLLRRTPADVQSVANKRDADKRRTRRIPQRMRNGFVFSDKMIAPRACMFRDLSIGGARIEVVGEPIKMSLLMDGLRLYFESEKYEIPCSVVWMNGPAIGLKFDGRPRPPSRTYK